MLISPFSAIPSWEGYEYQGHIALFVVLRKIRDLILYNNDIALNNFILEIEGAEDFSIKNGYRYLTLHQVKSGAIDLDKGDKFSFIISLLQYEAEHGYFHILPSKQLPNDFIQSTSDWIDSLQSDLDKEIKSKDGINEEDYSKYIILEKILPISTKGSKYSIIKYVCELEKYDVCEENVRKAVEHIKSELSIYSEKLKDTGKLIKDDKLMSKFDESFNNDLEIKKSSYVIIKEILNIKKPEWNLLIDDAYLEFLYGQVLLALKNKISQDYIEKTHINKVCHVEFETIFNILMEDFHTNSNSIKYQYFLLWKNILESYDKFPTKNKNVCQCESCSDCANNFKCNLYRQMDTISIIKDNQIHNFLYKLMLKEPKVGKPNNLPDDNLINRLFTNLLKEIELLSFEGNNLIQAQKNGLFFRLTLNSSGESYELQEQLDKEINNSLEDKLLIFENDVLITDQLNEESFMYNGIKTMVFGENEYKELESITTDSIEKIKKNYNKPKVLRLIDRKKAKEELSQ
ncbi:hypothetical protein Bccel_5817 [Pseudobacteroides cellulosolvens ATCC 35603 = DSM 2933]|uniref:ABC-three component systems C-terminal domain-containing protein n=1 Tax=Pseudobacteroides cellulosolvens ATCC 35603 = DSM 2933 TaxID=398512 RepID=A0A0L6JYJ7_9FIRM|nr:hypothetical protein Bccel_5817 [Pseudobacteroides cellulosolvens ATCC 35603 = DSM 2933]